MFHPKVSTYALLLLYAVLLGATDTEKALHPLEYRQNNVPTITAGGANPTSTTPTSATVAATITASVTPTATSDSLPSNTQSTDSSPPISTNTFTANTAISSQPIQASVTSVQSQLTLATKSTSSVNAGSNTRSTSSILSSAKTGSVTAQFLTTLVSVSGSSTFSSVQTTSRVVDAAAATSGAPGLVGGNGGSGSSGISSSTKKTIGGVIGGVGGAILLGGLAIVAWRIWGRKRRSGHDENDPMDSQPGSSGREKRSSVSGHSPFRSTLDQYHQAQPVNTASNF
ncbi:hypothetical protein N7G274_004681 [Stereocaulon virgatum]|uniref:Mid2 domain-containing protein n=1 Tax=Stereocaulon virgatum TaxID=373712 RepID=A0ABR4A939_9LECA